MLYSIILLAIGFTAGFNSFVPYENWKWNRSYQLRYKRLINQIAPDVSTTTITGEKWHLNDQKGKVLLIDFWATWCEPCVDSIPKLKAIQEKYAHHPDFEIIGVSLDESREDLESFLQDVSISWLQLFDEEAGWDCDFVSKFEITGIPSIWIIDRDNRIVGIDLHREEEIVRIIDLALE